METIIDYKQWDPRAHLRRPSRPLAWNRRNIVVTYAPAMRPSGVWGFTSRSLTASPLSFSYPGGGFSFFCSPAERKQKDSDMEQTFIMIKPDGVQRGLVGEIISRFEKKGFYLKGLKLMTVERSFAEKHYADLSSKPFFAGLVEYIISCPVVAMVWKGKDVVVTGRKIIGATNPAESAPGTIRGDLAIEIGR